MLTCCSQPLNSSINQKAFVAKNTTRRHQVTIHNNAHPHSSTPREKNAQYSLSPGAIPTMYPTEELTCHPDASCSLGGDSNLLRPRNLHPRPPHCRDRLGHRPSVRGACAALSVALSRSESRSSVRWRLLHAPADCRKQSLSGIMKPPDPAIPRKPSARAGSSMHQLASAICEVHAACTQRQPR